MEDDILNIIVFSAAITSGILMSSLIEWVLFMGVSVIIMMYLFISIRNPIYRHICSHYLIIANFGYMFGVIASYILVIDRASDTMFI